MYPIEDFAGVKALLKSLNLATYNSAMNIKVDEASGLTTLNLDLMQSFAVAMAVYFLGVWMKKKISVLERFCIPAPVAGGFVFAILHLIVRQTMNFSLGIDTTFQSPFMMVFFTTIGLTASIELIKKGGLGVIIFWVLASILCVFQDAIGLALAKVMGANPLLGLICGSITMTGGHGTGAAFAPKFAEMGLDGANVAAMAAATFGLVSGSIIGGPIGATLIRKNNLKSKAAEYTNQEVTLESEKEEINVDEVLKTLTIILISIAIGAVVSIPVKKAGITLPAYVTAMIVASILLNVGESTKMWHVNQKASSFLGTLSLNVFLSFALTGMQLWQLAEVAGPMMVILVAEVVFMALFAYFVTFKVMGSDFDAATIAAGHCGFGLGATPNGVANMTSVQEEFGPAPRAFFILPIVGAFLIDFTNSLIITIFVNIAQTMM
ncbi:sodium/glutamate symporter [Criibacterium bergeronii]|uniref:Sodium/glutamate symporter n=1 Tax=Criibacterium bergeronii TaxID=1871336 RepID=A0A552VCP8_9FIRM|nr:sodium/glutamate symporter [Criibacterium bergeronii]MBS6062944.1 sodium/glutamate symporter [Peptostreptococcaceae bacterium]TRW28256.1 sodium/glutamate symporter [Criibacterium bergeronii]